MLKPLKNNDHGVVFVTVLVIILATMILAISALSLNISQIKSSEMELKYIQAKTLADGVFVQLLMNQFSAAPGTFIGYTEIIGNTTFTMTSEIFPASSGPSGSSTVQFNATVTF